MGVWPVAYCVVPRKWNLWVQDMEGMFWGATFFNRKLCGSAWVHSKASKELMFEGSPGSISEPVCTFAMDLSLIHI